MSRPSASAAAPCVPPRDGPTPTQNVPAIDLPVAYSNTLSTDPQLLQTLAGRLEQQAHWRLASAVQRGEQSATDPDAYDLEELQDGLRLYGTRDQQRRTVEGRNVLLTQRLTKRLADGSWTTVYETEQVRPA